MTKAVWFLDVDGVLNACPWDTRADEEPPAPAWPDMAAGSAAANPQHGFKYTITYSPTLMASIRELHESGAVEVRWLTTWANGANGELRELLGLPEFELVAPHPKRSKMTQMAKRGVWWKRPLALSAMAELGPDARIIWTDDDLRLAPNLVSSLAKVGVLAIAPDTRLGITPLELDRIKAYIESGDVGLAA
jgi:hypothetical protein